MECRGRLSEIQPKLNLLDAKNLLGSVHVFFVVINAAFALLNRPVQ